ncbi:MAG: thioredoxin fold domain-containing protein [Phycisphaerae bacterium]|nr:thioredoxin fold domain-containing protein [Phycisphaerae bacterium]
MKDAATSDRPIFIDFYTTWCPPCKMLDARTWSDSNVAKWLQEKTIPLKIDAEAQAQLAEQYALRAYPTLLFLKADGTEIDRIVGFVDPDEFLTEAEGILSGKDPLTRARAKLEEAGETDPMARMEFAKKLDQMGRNEEALTEYLWCFDEGNQHDMSFVGVRLSFLLSDIAKLSKRYPPARIAMLDRRDRAVERILAEDEDHLLVMEVTSINENFDEGKNTLELYDRLKARDPHGRVVRMMQDDVFDLLLEYKRYQELATSWDIQAGVDAAFDRTRSSLLSRVIRGFRPKETQERQARYERHRMLREVGRYYEIFLGVGRLDDAAQVAQRLIDFDDDAQTYNSLAWHGYRTGKPIPANVEQARKAFELTEGTSAAVIDTLARVLHATGQGAEARGLLAESLQRDWGPYEQQKLQQAQVDLQAADTEAVQRSPAGYLLLAILVVGLGLFVWRRRRVDACAETAGERELV